MSDEWTIDIEAIAVNDIVGASSRDFENVCIVSSVDGDVICARVVNGQYDIRFDRDTGLALSDYGHSAGYARITFAQKLPQDLEIGIRALDAVLRATGGSGRPERILEHQESSVVIRSILAHMTARRGTVVAPCIAPGMA